MKRTVLLLGCLLSMGLYAQTSPNGVYSTTETRPAVLEKPASREIMGGTVIRVNFDETNAISATQKGAFEYACRIWEENIPTTFPINITVKFGTLQNPQCLAYVEPTVGLLESDAYSSQCFSNVYFLKSATKLFSVLLASKRPLITELADKLRLKYPLLPTISPCPTMRLEAIRSIIPISCRRYPKSV